MRRMPMGASTWDFALSPTPRRRAQRRAAFLVLWTLCSGAAPPVSTSSVTKSLYAEAVSSGPIEVDGRLDEAAWTRAAVGSGFIERVPTPGKTPPVATEFRVLVKAEAMYVGVVCHRSPGGSLRALELQRDSFGVFSDDALSLKIDIRHDTRTTVGFVTNPAGVQLDYVAVENGGAFRREFDAIWRVSTQIYEDRWVAEFELPAVALGLPPASSGPDWKRVVGLNVTRDHNGRLATYDWSPIPPEFGPTSALFYGDLLGLEALGSGRPLSLIPYALGAYESASRPELRGRVGGDVRLRIAEDMWGELTILTDFAQVDLDDPVVNLDRFPLFFPERRPFFLSGLEFFEFGASGEADLYFSRRIGLDDGGNTIELLGGAKAYGTAGALRFGALAALTDQSLDRPGQSFSVLRVRQNFGETAHLGVIGTLRTDVGFLGDDETPVQPRVSVGIDGAARGFGRRFEAEVFGALSTAPDHGGAPDDFASQASLRWRGYLLQPEVSLLVISPDFDPAVGFVRRPGQITPRVSLPWTTRTTAFGLQQITATAIGTVVRDYEEDRVLTQTASGQLEVLLRSGFGGELFAEAKEDFVIEDTSIVGFDVAAGRYRGYFAQLRLFTPEGRNPSGSIAYSRNTAFFGGRADRFEASFGVRFGPHVQTTAAANLSLLDFGAQGNRTTLTANGGITVTPDALLQVDLIGQANTFAEEATLLGRLRWRYLPGSDMFLVYRERLDWRDRRLRSDRSLTLKIGYRYDALL